jgi:D-aminopeptidase
MAETMTGIDGNTAYALPLERLPAILEAHGRPVSAPPSRKAP